MLISKIYRLILLLIIAVNTPFIILARNDYGIDFRHHYYFKSLCVADGLSQNTVYDIVQDKFGYIWLATKDGLNRYDGVRIRVFNNSNSGLQNNIIKSICQDEVGGLWIGTDDGLYYYDPQTESVKRLDAVSQYGNGIESEVIDVNIDNEGSLWVACHQGLFRYNSIENKMLQYLNCIGDQKEVEVPTTCIFHDGSSRIFSLYEDNVYITDDEFSNYRPYLPDIDVFKGLIVNVISDGPYNCRYFGTSAGLYEYNMISGVITKLTDSYVRDLLIVSGTDIWAATEDGLYIFKMKDDNAVHLTASEINDPYSLSDNALYSLCVDKDGGILIGSYFGGVNYYPPQLTYFEKCFPMGTTPEIGRRVREFCRDSNEKLWIGTEDKGLFLYERKSGVLSRYRSDMLHTNIHGLCRDDDYLWVGTFSSGLYRIDCHTGHIKHYVKGTDSNTLSSNDIFDIYRTKHGDLWIATTCGLLTYNYNDDNFTRVPGFDHNFIYCISEDIKGNVWLGGYMTGVYRYDAVSGKWTHYSASNEPNTLAHNRVVDIFEDSKHRLWFATDGNGFCRYNADTDDFTRYGANMSVPCRVCYSIVEDNAGCLWITTGNGLLQFNPENEVARTFTRSSGLHTNQFNYKSTFRDDDGYIYAGSTDGFIKFRPEDFHTDIAPSSINISDVFINSERPEIGKGKQLVKSVTFSNELELRPGQNLLTLHVATFSFDNYNVDRVIYTLDGADTDWHMLDDDFTIRLSNLPYGSYVLRLRWLNSLNQAEAYEKTLKICVSPPFYLSTLAYVIYALLIISLVFVLVRFFLSDAKKKQIASMQKFEIEKERELFVSKIDFFTAIAHEIRTPLSLIKGPLENILSSEHLHDDLREDMMVMDLNTNRLLTLINQLLDFRKSEFQGSKLNFVECNISLMLNKVCKRFLPQAKRMGIDLRIEAPDELKASVDNEAMIKVIDNLLNNALKYAHSFIILKLTYSDNDFRIEIANDGSIIPQAMREIIFEPFVQYKERDTECNSKSNVGTGIGLALSRSIVEQHGGKLYMDEDLSCNRFIVNIPIKNVCCVSTEIQDVESNVTDCANSEDMQHSQKHETVLVVEDNEDMLRFITRCLTSEYNVITANNGHVAQEMLDANVVNLIVSDLMMPEVDGLQLCEYVKKTDEFSHIPFIILSAKTSVKAKLNGLDAGADAYIEKPFSPQYLTATIRNILRNRESLRNSFKHSAILQSDALAVSKADETFIKRLSEVIDKNMGNSEFGLDDMAIELNLSRTSLNRKINGLFDLSPIDYLRLERIKRAANLFKSGCTKVNDVLYAVGFNSPSYFSKCFQKHFGVTPKEYIKQCEE